MHEMMIEGKDVQLLGNARKLAVCALTATVAAIKTTMESASQLAQGTSDAVEMAGVSYVELGLDGDGMLLLCSTGQW